MTSLGQRAHLQSDCKKKKKKDGMTLTSPSFCAQVLKKIARYIKDQNEKIYAPRGLLLTDPIERGLRVVSLIQLHAY